MRRLNSVLQVVANAGVILGLVFVALELRQNTETTRAQTRTEVSQAVVNLIALETDPRAIQAFLKVEQDEPLTEEERVLLRRIANATFRVWENSYYQYERNLFAEGEFQADREVWIELMKDPIYRELWLETRHTYSPGLRGELDAILQADR